MEVSSRSLDSLTSSRADSSEFGSMRMSSGASTAYEKPRSGRSICMLETPRSKSTASARTPFEASCSSTSENSPRRKRPCTAVRLRNRSKYARAAGSLSIAISLPLPRRSDAKSSACPPAPKVASTTVSPGRTASASRTSSARTGTWSVALGRKTFGNILRTPFHLRDVLLPRRSVPDLEVVAHPRDHDLAADPCVLGERRRQHHAALLVGLGLGGAREEIAVHQAALPAEWVEPGQPFLDEPLPGRLGIAVETPVH